MKYTLAIESNQHNCTRAKGHQFDFIRDREEIKEIRKQHPKLTLALWRCEKCGKVKESM